MISNIPRRNCSNDSTWWKSKQPSICKEGDGGKKSLVIQERELGFKAKIKTIYGETWEKEAISEALVHQAILLPSKNGKDQPEPTNHFEITNVLIFPLSLIYHINCCPLSLIFHTNCWPVVNWKIRFLVFRSVKTARKKVRRNNRRIFTKLGLSIWWGLGLMVLVAVPWSKSCFMIMQWCWCDDLGAKSSNM